MRKLRKYLSNIFIKEQFARNVFGSSAAEDCTEDNIDVANALFRRIEQYVWILLIERAFVFRNIVHDRESTRTPLLFSSASRPRDKFGYFYRETIISREHAVISDSIRQHSLSEEFSSHRSRYICFHALKKSS